MTPLKQSKNIAARMGRWSASHRKTAIFGWLAFVVAAFSLSTVVGLRLIDENDVNVGEARAADHIVRDAGFPKDEQSEIVIVQSKGTTMDDPAFRAVVVQAIGAVSAFEQVDDVESPLAPGNADLISDDRHAAMIPFRPRGDYREASLYIDGIVSSIAEVQKANPDYYVGSVGTSTDKALDSMFGGMLALAGLIAIPLTFGMLLLVFRSLVAALVPLLLALTSVIATMGLVTLPSLAIPMSQEVMEVILLVGLAVGVDYSLFYLKREREERKSGRSESAALEAAAATSGRAVLVSGMTVIIAMAGMLFSGDQMFISFGIGTILVVAVAMIGSLTVLPAVLSWLGDRVEKGRIPFLHRLRGNGDNRLWAAILDRVLRRPLVSALAAGAFLLLLAAPAVSLHPAISGVDALPKSLPELTSLNVMRDAFPGETAATVAIRADDVNAAPVKDAIADLEAKALASGQMYSPIDIEISPNRSGAVVSIPIAGEGTDEASNQALETLRNEIVPTTLGQLEGVEYAVGGDTAASRDYNDSIKSSMPLVFGFVLVFAFLLLLVSFRSIVIALKAILLNLLSVAAAYGVIVAFFQWGWGENLLDFESNGGIAAWLPMFLFVILFGLSMDYHVFILSRIREAYDRGLRTDEAIAHGIKGTAGVVTSAAMIMVGVFAVFAILPFRDFKEMGIGLAVAVLIDATIVRAVLLPATMKLLGDRNWYLPKWLEWLPSLEHERSVDAPDEATPALGQAT
jgi:RND superfamily putative drug exporter